MRLPEIILASFFLGCCNSAAAQEINRTTLGLDHPLLGTWGITFRDINCYEEFELRSDGTRLSMSADERNEAEFEISATRRLSGFYKWKDRITNGNGMPDCHGYQTEIGSTAENYILLRPDGQKFLLCDAEELKSCYAEFSRKVLF